MSSPLFSVDAEEIPGLFSKGFEIELLHSQDVPAGNERLAGRGLNRMREQTRLDPW
jgi:hypothetical protein